MPFPTVAVSRSLTMQARSAKLLRRTVRPYRGFSRAFPWERVLDVGSGDNPHPRADTLVDLLDAEADRWRVLASCDRLVVADAHRLPFADKAFGVVICTHCLEHCDDPQVVIAELVRIAHRGLIEVPTLYSDALFQPYNLHRWVFAIRRDGVMIFAPAPQLDCIPTAPTTIELIRRNRLFRYAFLLDTCAFRLRVFWREGLRLQPAPLEEVMALASARANDLTVVRASIRAFVLAMGWSLDTAIRFCRSYLTFRFRYHRVR